jgi:hypothetical protein
VKVSSCSMKHVGVWFNYGHTAVSVLQAKGTRADGEARDVWQCAAEELNS